MAKVLDKVAELLRRGEAVLIYPEGGRSRTGRVDIEAATYGTGRLVSQVPGCRVFCVYLRGRRQETWTDAPARGDVFDVASRVIEPKSERKGLRGSVEISKQIVACLAEMEKQHFEVHAADGAAR